MLFYYFCAILAGIPILLLWPTRVLNKKNRPRRGGALVCCNHYSLVDAPIMGVHFLSRRFRFVAKKEFASNPFGGFIMWATGSVAVERGKPSFSAMKKIIALLKKKKVVLLFPEGHRNKDADGDLQELKRGAVMTAMHAGVPVIPALLYARPRFFRRNYIAYGAPVDLSDLSGRKLTGEVLEEGTARLGADMAALRAQMNAYVATRKKRRARS